VLAPASAKRVPAGARDVPRIEMAMNMASPSTKNLEDNIFFIVRPLSIKE
jgi:hypothetical protein